MSTYLPAQASACAVSLSFILPEMGKEVYRQSMNNVQVPFHDESMDKSAENRRFAVDILKKALIIRVQLNSLIKSDGGNGLMKSGNLLLQGANSGEAIER